MTKFELLIEGYAKQTDNGWMASSNVIYIKDNDKKIIIDPGINKSLLLKNLKNRGLTPAEINIVFLTHYHPDHSYLSAIFKNAKLVDGYYLYEEDKEILYEGKIPGTNLKIIHTPGHSTEHSSILIKTKEGNIAIAGDLFWWTQNEKQNTNNLSELLNRNDHVAENVEQLRLSREKVLSVADWIIPGHGKIFKNPKKKI